MSGIIASTVYPVFLALLFDFDNRHGISLNSMFPILPVDGQWHFSTLPLISTIIMNLFGLDLINPLISCSSKAYFSIYFYGYLIIKVVVG